MSIQKLQAAHAELLETEKVGQEIVANLQDQTSQLKKMKDTSCEINKDLTRSNRLLTRMGKLFNFKK